jgi:hypothetical protein
MTTWVERYKGYKMPGNTNLHFLSSIVFIKLTNSPNLAVLLVCSKYGPALPLAITELLVQWIYSPCICMPNSMADTVWSPYLSEAWELTFIRSALFKVKFALLVSQVPFHTPHWYGFWGSLFIGDLSIEATGHHRSSNTKPRSDSFLHGS